MLRKLRFQALGISLRDFTLVFILLFNTITWYFMTLMWANRLIDEMRLEYLEPLILTVYNAAITLAVLAGSVFSTKFSRIRFLFLWMFLGALTSWSLVLLNTSVTTYIVVLSFLLGATFGIGLPTCFAYFADQTVIDNRGTIAGIILLILNFSTLPIAISFVMLNLDLATMSFVFGFWRLIGLISFLSLKPRENMLSDTGRNVSFAPTFSSRGFLLYVLPWLMFSFVNGLEEPIVRNSLGTELFKMMTTMAPLIGGVSAFIGGFFADRIGRKRVVMIGFVTVGLAYAVLGFASQETIAQYLFGVVDAWSWGIFLALFFAVLWGDLSQAASREKYYAVGTSLHYLTFIISQISTPYVEFIPANAAFSLAAFFLFLAVLPLMYAPETLPEKKIELRRLRGYVEQAKKARDRYLKKAGT